MYMMVPKLFGIFGEVKFWSYYPHYPEEAWAFVGDGYLNIEIDVISKKKANFGYWLKDAKIIYDKDGKYTKSVFKSRKDTFRFKTHDEVITFLLNTRSNFFYGECSKAQRA